MKLQELLKLIGKPNHGNENLLHEVLGVTKDSREVKEGFVFFAVSNDSVDGHGFIAKAVEKGAIAIVHESALTEKSKAVNYIIVKDSAEVFSLCSAAFQGWPARKLHLTAVTGTNGKTTHTYLMEALLKKAAFKPGIIGTISFRFADKSFSASNTTPQASEYQKLLSDMLGEKVTHVVTEISSHALSLKRTEHIEPDIALFTNLTQDHLDFHKNFENYYLAKRRLFTELLANSSKKDKKAFIFIDDEFGKKLAQDLKKNFSKYFKTYSLSLSQPEADIFADEISIQLKASTFNFKWGNNTYKIQTPLIGYHNVANSMSAMGVALGMGIPVDLAKEVLAHFSGVPGRLEKVENSKDRFVFVDYAHTPDALENVISALKKVSNNPLTTVFGCGGDRDPKKRPLMGEIAARLSDKVIVTSDNPRTEDPEYIIDQIVPGIEKHTKNYIRESDREKAIEKAIMESQTGGVILIAGKGHEDYQIIGKTKIHFSDQEIARKYLESL